MKATEILMSEHEVIEQVITALDANTGKLEAGQAVRPGFFLDAVEFIRGFADGCHHLKEEQVLFKSMVENGLPVQGGPIGVMLSEHEQGRVYTRGLKDSAQRLEAGDPTARAAIIQNARAYAALLRQHILKENTILFPMADRVLPPAAQAAVEDGFEHVEHEETGAGVHEKYLALAGKLTSEAGLA